MGSWSQSRDVTRRAWGVVRTNPYLLVFPVLAAVLALIAIVIVAGIGLAVLGVTRAEQEVRAAADETLTTGQWVTAIVILILAAYLATLATQIMMGALVKCADEELQGRKSSVGVGLSASLRRLPALMGWAAIQAAVGWLLSALRGGGSNQNLILTIVRLIAATALSVAWYLITFFVLPLIILRDCGPVHAIKESAGMLKRTWGTQVAGGVRIGGLIFLIAILPGIVAIVGGGILIFANAWGVGLPLIALGVIVVIIAQVFLSALRAVFSVALFHYADGGAAIGPFTREQLQGAVRAKV